VLFFVLNKQLLSSLAGVTRPDEPGYRLLLDLLRRAKYSVCLPGLSAEIWKRKAKFFVCENRSAESDSRPFDFLNSENDLNAVRQFKFERRCKELVLPNEPLPVCFKNLSKTATTRQPNAFRGYAADF
jgi:hypothetical protein